MELRKKLNVLTFVYIASLGASLVISVWCITRYFQTGFTRFQADLRTGQRVEGMLSRLRDVKGRTERGEATFLAIAEFRTAMDAVAAELAAGADGEAGETLASALASAGRAATDLRKRSGTDQAVFEPAGDATPDMDPGAVDRLERALFEVGTRVGLQRQENLERAMSAQQGALTLLILNAACGMGLCALGLASIRRWLLQPVEILRRGIRAISLGDLSHRVELVEEGELQSLAREVNRMSSAIDAMRAIMIRRERVAATGSMMQFVVHNIRTPLLGIRWLTEVLPPLPAPTGDAARARKEIVERIDALNEWLHRLQDGLSPVRLRIESVSFSVFFEEVLADARECLADRGITVHAEVSPDLRTVCIDGSRLRSAVKMLLERLARLCLAGHAVEIRADYIDPDGSFWQFAIQVPLFIAIPDSEYHSLSFLLNASEPGNEGFESVNRIALAHGGQLSIRSSAEEGTCFTLILPIKPGV